MSTSFNFPLDPTLNQIVVLPDGNSAQWNGYAWVSVGDNVTYPLAVPKGGTGATNPFTAKRNLEVPIWTLDDAMPAAPVFGDRWIRPGSMTEVVWLPNAGGTGVWVNLADAGSSAAYPIAISKGGTGATTAAQARINLGITNANIGSLPIDGTGAMTGVLKVADGTVAAPGLAWNSEPGMGWYRPSAGVRNFAIGGQSVETIGGDATNTFISYFPRTSGGVSQLTLHNNIQSSAAQHQFYMRHQPTGYILGEALQGGATPARPLTLGFPAGIGTTGKLTVQGDVTINPDTGSFRFGTTGGAVNLNASNGFPAIQFSATGADYQLIHVRSSGDFVYQKPGAPAKNLLTINGNESGVSIVGSLTAAGNVNAGAAFRTQGDTAVVFDVNRATQYIALGDPGYGSQFQLAFIHASGLWAGIRFIVQAAQYQFTDSGQARATTAGPWAALLSDVRAKERIEDYTDGLDAILALRPRVFSFKPETGLDSTRRWINLIAQEAQEAMPSLVIPATVTELGTIKHDDLLSLDIGPITFALVNAVKTLDARLKAAGL